MREVFWGCNYVNVCLFKYLVCCVLLVLCLGVCVEFDRVYVIWFVDRCSVVLIVSLVILRVFEFKLCWVLVILMILVGVEIIVVVECIWVSVLNGFVVLWVNIVGIVIFGKCLVWMCFGFFGGWIG